MVLESVSGDTLLEWQGALCVDGATVSVLKRAVVPLHRHSVCQKSASGCLSDSDCCARSPVYRPENLHDMSCFCLVIAVARQTCVQRLSLAFVFGIARIDVVVRSRSCARRR